MLNQPMLFFVFGETLCYQLFLHCDKSPSNVCKLYVKQLLSQKIDMKYIGMGRLCRAFQLISFKNIHCVRFLADLAD